MSQREALKSLKTTRAKKCASKKAKALGALPGLK
jgi:hypothetical protein